MLAGKTGKSSSSTCHTRPQPFACIEDILMGATRRQHPFSLRRLKNYPAQKVDKKSGQRNYWRQLRQRWRRRRRRRTVQYAQCVPDGNMIKVKAKTSNKGVLGQDVLQLPLTVAGLCKGTSGVVWSLPGESTDGIRKGTSTCSRLGKWKIGEMANKYEVLRPFIDAVHSAQSIPILRPRTKSMLYLCSSLPRELNRIF